jgi:hypothetical protein
MTKKAIEKIDINSRGTHQLAFRLISVNVLLGAINVFIRRCGSDRPGPVGSGETGEDATGYIGGGGVGPVGELINHPTFQFVESYSFHGRNQISIASILQASIIMRQTNALP